MLISYATQYAISAVNVENVNISNIKITEIGEMGLVVNGYNNIINNNHLTEIGCGGMSVTGGDELQLIRGNNIIDNNKVDHYAAWKRTFVPGITYGGVGDNYTNNVLADSPHEGVIGLGNDYLFDNNTFMNLAYEVTDAGGWHCARSWAHRGTVVSNNLFINMSAIEKTYLGWPVIAGIYLDDQLSGHNITGNTFINTNVGIQVGGGRRVNVWNNYFAKCTSGSCITYDDRGLNWEAEFCASGGLFQQQLEAVNYTQPPWSIHYPELPNIYNDQPCVPVYDQFFNNQYCCGKGMSDDSCKFINQHNDTIYSWNSSEWNNVQINWSNEYC